MLRKLFAGHRIECHPEVTADRTHGYHVKATGTYAARRSAGTRALTVVSPTGFVRFTPLPEQLGTTVFEGVVWPKAG